MQMNDITCRGLRSVLSKFDEDGEFACGTHWHIARGGYDLWWELYYDNTPVVDCVCNEIENLCLPDKIFKRVYAVIKSEYDRNCFYPIKMATG